TLLLISILHSFIIYAEHIFAHLVFYNIIGKLPIFDLGIGYIIYIPLGKQAQHTYPVYICYAMVLHQVFFRVITFQAIYFAFIKHFKISTLVSVSHHIINHPVVSRFKKAKTLYAVIIKHLEIA